MAEPDNSSIRASDADREAVAERLRVALNEGRITIAEYDDRLRATYASATRAELSPLTADLPEPAPPSVEKVKRDRDRKKLVKDWRDWAGTSFLLIGIWLITSLFSGEMLPFWPIFPVGIWAVVLLAGMLFGGDDTDIGDGDDGGSNGSVAR
ncbi:uncharacterized protein DUF1707 [Halopolyspora algeriensis]|uniref:Uncharacterized protein DUF1707 n=1 Tax=Halopolyspora algeriensis TaxID=1500506 RepID=A0A368W536_9ACTN|nr:DUF1707 domain-containing protein [Halopolyspora algeriensis]RCW47160.1 uncharacterized protein DUF1707 [Halopolyspora algeriensis]TQM48246.1 uncharacterized protein DUF1707 [Halopolyspora algeriensis]